jgi:hypothetical protein
MTLKRIRLELARDPDFPEGSARHGYEFVAPLDNDDHIDVEGWRRERKRCTVSRFWGYQPEEQGHLMHTRGRSWAFHYDVAGDEDSDEAGYHFENHLFKVGEYVSIREHDGVLRTFMVVSVNAQAGVAAGRA